MKSEHFARRTRIAGISALGLGVGLVLSACNPSTSSAVGAASSAAASDSGSTRGAATNATPENVNGQPPVLFDCKGQPVVEPTNYELDCFDALNDLENLHWTKWGQFAVATGTEKLDNCVPSCTKSKSTYYPVSIRAYDDRDVSGEPRPTYTEMTIDYAGAMPTISNGETGGVITQRQPNSWSEKLPTFGG